jgi:hypothetical protein
MSLYWVLGILSNLFIVSNSLQNKQTVTTHHFSPNFSSHFSYQTSLPLSLLSRDQLIERIKLAEQKCDDDPIKTVVSTTGVVPTRVSPVKSVVYPTRVAHVKSVVPTRVSPVKSVVPTRVAHVKSVVPTRVSPIKSVVPTRVSPIKSVVPTRVSPVKSVVYPTRVAHVKSVVPTRVSPVNSVVASRVSPTKKFVVPTSTVSPAPTKVTTPSRVVTRYISKPVRIPFTFVTSTGSGDPHIDTFDGLHHDTMISGWFIWVKNSVVAVHVYSQLGCMPPTIRNTCIRSVIWYKLVHQMDQIL